MSSPRSSQGSRKSRRSGRSPWPQRSSRTSSGPNRRERPAAPFASKGLLDLVIGLIQSDLSGHPSQPVPAACDALGCAANSTW